MSSRWASLQAVLAIFLVVHSATRLALNKPKRTAHQSHQHARPIETATTSCTRSTTGHRLFGNLSAAIKSAIYELIAVLTGWTTTSVMGASTVASATIHADQQLPESRLSAGHPPLDCAAFFLCAVVRAGADLIFCAALRQPEERNSRQHIKALMHSALNDRATPVRRPDGCNYGRCCPDLCTSRLTREGGDATKKKRPVPM